MRRLNSSTGGRHGEDAEAYPHAADLARPTGQVAMWRRPRLQAPGSRVHVVGRCSDREFCFTEPEGFHNVMARLGETARTYAVTLYASTLMDNHVHLLLQAPVQDPLTRPLRWFFCETTRAWQAVHGRRSHFWGRRYWGCPIEDDTYAPAALRYLDRNPVRAGLAEVPAAYPRSSCAAYALGTPNPLISYHPSYLGLSRYSKDRQRHYRTLGSATFFARPGLQPGPQGEIGELARQNQ